MKKKNMPNLIFTLLLSHVREMRYEDAQKLVNEYNLTPKQKGLYIELLNPSTNESKN